MFDMQKITILNYENELGSIHFLLGSPSLGSYLLDISRCDELYSALKSLKKSDEPKGGCDNPFDFLFCSGNPADALLYYSLFCPKLIQIGRVVVLSLWQDDPETFTKLNRQVQLYQDGQVYKEEFEEFVSGFTYIELSYSFNRGNGTVSHEQEYLLAECIVSSWEAWLPSKFPSEQFKFSITPSSIDEEDDIEISFVQEL